MAGASEETNHVCPPASFAVKPAAAPALFSRVIVHEEGSGAGPSTGPATSSSAVSERAPMRLVNQLPKFLNAECCLTS